MEWTTRKPTKAGTYWRCWDGREVHAVEIWKRSDDLLIDGFATPVRDPRDDMLWMGPIKKPDPPEEFK